MGATTNANKIAGGKLMEHWGGDPEMLQMVMKVSEKFDQHLEYFATIFKWYRGHYPSRAKK